MPSRAERRRSRPLRSQVRAGAALLLLPLLVVGLVAIAVLMVGVTTSASLADEQTEDLQIQGLQNDLRLVALKGVSFLATGGADDRTGLPTAVARVDADFQTLTALDSLRPSQRAAIARARTAWTTSSGVRVAIAAVGSTASEPTAERLEESLSAAITSASTQLDQARSVNAEEVASLTHEREVVDRAARVTVLLSLLLAAASGLILMRRISGPIVASISALQAASQRIAAGDSRSQVAVSGPAEIEDLGRDFNTMVERLNERELAVEKQEQRLLALIENANDGILVVSTAGVIDFATPALTSAFIGECKHTDQLRDLIHPDDLPRLQKAWQRTLGDNPGSGIEIDVQLRHRDGTWRHVSVRLSNHLENTAVSGVILNVTDITERHEYEQKLAYQALHDPLTGLANRRLFIESTDRALREQVDAGAAHAILYLDFDDFKQVNDMLGHKTGDEFLAAMAHRVVDSVRPDDLVARLGGDEFAVLLRDTGQRQGVAIARRILAAIAAPWVHEGKEIHPRASVGIAVDDSRQPRAEVLLADSDVAMYFAKRNGKGRIAVFTPQMRDELVDRVELGEDLRTALDPSALTLQYQPIISFETGRTVGVEALARWRHPARGWVSPSTFIPLAEEIGVVDRIGAWVIAEACRQAMSWKSRGHADLRISVNISGSDLLKPGLAGLVRRTLAETGLPAERLELEVTEGVAVNDSPTARATLTELKQMGVGLAIDDFGTGYSALAQLHRLPFDILKVDKAFVDELTTGAGETSLIRTILEMARVLKLEVVAEGVETKEQADILRERHCTYAQGYFFSRPVDAADIEKRLGLEAEGPNPATLRS